MATQRTDPKTAEGAGAGLPQSRGADFTRAAEATDDVRAAIKDAFDYQPWNDRQTQQGSAIRNILAEAVAVIVANSPPCPDRSAAIRKLREARMDANSAITHAGKY